MQARVGLTKTFSFEAGHHLLNYEGKCARDHGHSYKLKVSISGLAGKEDKAGILVDFDLLTRAAQDVVVLRYDHRNLNEFFGKPTAEVMVRKMWHDLATWFLSNAPPGLDIWVDQCELWETEKCSAKFPVHYGMLDGPGRDSVWASARLTAATCEAKATVSTKPEQKELFS